MRISPGIAGFPFFLAMPFPPAGRVRYTVPVLIMISCSGSGMFTVVPRRK